MIEIRTSEPHSNGPEAERRAAPEILAGSKDPEVPARGHTGFLGTGTCEARLMFKQNIHNSLDQKWCDEVATRFGVLFGRLGVGVSGYGGQNHPRGVN